MVSILIGNLPYGDHECSFINLNTSEPLHEDVKGNIVRLGCLKNAKSLKSQAPQGFSGCLDIENDEMNKKKFLSASPRVN